MGRHGPGVRFHPTDVELVVYYLKNQVIGRKFHRDGIRVLNVYDFAPWDLPGKARWKRDLKWYFFCPRERKYTTGERRKRTTEHGFWKTTGKDRAVDYNGETAGMRKSLIFHTLNPTERTNWVMHEYRLRDGYLKQPGLEEDVFVLCVIFEKAGPGPRNGAQYGGPYRDEDWDDDNDCDTDDDEADDELDNCRENTNVDGTLTEVHTDKGKSTVPNDFERAGRYCAGSSSRTRPSDIDRTDNLGCPPLSNECGMFLREIPLASPENEQAQDIGVDQDITREPSIPANGEKIYDGSEELCSLRDFADSGVIAHGCHFRANQNVQPDDCLELADCMDVSGPFEGSHDHDHIGPGQPSPSFAPMIPEGVPVSTFVGQQNLSVGISDGMLSWNEHRQEPAGAERERPINDPQTGLSRFRFSNLPDYISSELHIPYLDQCPPVFEGSNVLRGFGEYGPFWQHPRFSDGLVGQGFGDNVPYLNPHHHLDSGAIGFGDQYFGENVPYLNPHHDDYLELADCMDVSGPFEGSHDHDHIGPGQPSPSFGPMIPEGVPVSTFVGQQNLSVGISDGMLSWNEHRQEPAGAERERPINDPQTGLSRFRFSNLPDYISSELHIPYLDQSPPVFEGSNVLRGSGEYGPFWQHPRFSDGLVGQGFGDNVPYLNPHHHLDSGAIGFGDQYFGENVPYLNPHHDDYLELAECMYVSGPFEGSHDHDHIGPGQPSPSFGPMIPEGVPVSAFVGQQSLTVGISDGMLSWNEHRQEPAERERPINDPQTGLSRFGFSNLPDSVNSELHIPYLDQCPPVFEGSNDLRGSGEYGPFWQQFAQGPGQSLRENVSSLRGPQFAEDSVGLGVHGLEENVSHMNQHGQTADGSIGFHGQEASINGQMDDNFDGVGTAEPFGIMQPPQSIPRGSPHYPS